MAVRNGMECKRIEDIDRLYRVDCIGRYYFVCIFFFPKFPMYIHYSFIILDVTMEKMGLCKFGELVSFGKGFGFAYKYM